jgi:hypothetical protein
MNDLGPGGLMDPANADKLEEASDRLDSDEVTKANDQIDAYIEKSCS